MKAKEAFENMIADKAVSLTKEGREFWMKGRLWGLGRWFYIQKVSSDSVDIVGEYHDVMINVPLEYIK